MKLSVDDHPLLDLRAFVTTFPNTLGELDATEQLRGLLSLDAAAPMQSSDAVRSAVRELLRSGGFRPTGRSKPASEYLIKAASNSHLDSINLAVDVGNAVSLHSGLPVSVIDLEIANGPFRVATASAEESYVFNLSGQVIQLGGLLCLYDSQGACANAVKDSQRTKTHPGTKQTLSLIWGPNKLAARVAKAEAWYCQLLEDHHAQIEPCSKE